MTERNKHLVRHVEMLPGWLDAELADRALDVLSRTAVVPWRSRSDKFGHPVPRLEAWYHLDNSPYRYSGVTRQAEPHWPAALVALFGRVVAAGGVGINSVLLNLYRDGKDSVGWHSDDEPGLEGPIYSLSLGTSRDFAVRLKADHAVKETWRLDHGDLAIMGAGSQRVTEHTVPKRLRERGHRINLTFRRLT